jgi:outer membrane protein assembly factor BamB
MALRVKISTVLVTAVLATAGFSQRCSAQASITLSEKIGPPTSTLFVAGTGFQPDIGVDIYFGDHDEALAVTNEEGQFPQTRISVPGTAAPGANLVSAVGRNNGGAAQNRFIVNTDWSQTGFTAAQTNWNPYENVLSPGNVYRMGPLWSSGFGTTYGYGPESAAPTTYQGKVYVSWVGGGLDYLTAFDELTGASDWEDGGTGSSAAISDGIAYSASEGYLAAFNASTGAILGEFMFSPNYDHPPPPPVVADGNVFFGTANGSFYALDHKTAEPLWSVSGKGDIPSAPAVGDGNVYFCSSTCYAYYALNGFPLWQYSGGGGATPAVSGSMVVVNGPRGTTALDPNYGTVLWQSAASGSDAAVATANGVVFVSAIAGVFALNAATGSPLWDAPIVSGFFPSVANGVVYVSGSNEFLYALDAASGKILWDYFVGTDIDITSSPSVVNGRIYITALSTDSGAGILYTFGLKN